MQNIDVVIKKRLMELCPTLRPDGFDAILVAWCKEDMFQYLHYLKEYQEFGGWQIKYIITFYFGRIRGRLHTLFNLQIMAGLYEDEVNEWLNMWIGLWWKKFQQRVKLYLKPKPKQLKTTKERSSGVKFWNTKLNQEEREFIVKNAVNTLINYGEIVRPSTLARLQIFLRLSRYTKKNETKEWTTEDTINFDKSLRDHLKQMAYTHGPILWIFPSKQAYMREWRDDSEITA